AAQGATTVRPAKAARFARARLPSVTVVQNGREVEHRARLVVAADGKLSAARRWTGGESRSDPEHHRIGGVLVAGAAIERTTVGAALQPGSAAAWFAAGPDLTRVYLAIDAPQSRSAGVDRSFTAFRAFVSARMPTYALMQAQQAGPLGFFPNSNTWATRIAGNGVALVGDAAGSADPTYGHGTSLLFRDVRILGELLCSTADWDAAVADFADRRRKAFDVIRASDRWAALCNEASEEAARRRDGNERALQQDPTLGGFALLHTAGPDGLLADETARRHYFGEDLS
ncbi:MAG TPA: FAD-dependent monooxygenase, partial [Thermomicrobiales bacterium]|nr:FAD-dependent monooxygenase [Thermomicrobiales bacterium]